jgi:Tat protein translocase TatB subunit
MFDFGGSLQEILLILVVALLVVGPKRLPEVGRMVARAMREFRRAHDEFRSTIETNLYEPDPAPPRPNSDASEASPLGSVPEAAGPSADPPVSTVTEPVPCCPEPYLARRGGRLFHARDCGWAARVSASARLGFERPSDATQQGFLPCPVCRPSAP